MRCWPPTLLGGDVTAQMDDDQRFLLDLQGYLVIPSLLSRDQVAAANAAVDHHFASAPPIRRGSADPSAGGLLSEESPGLVGQQGRAEFYGFLGWPAPHCDLFRELMVTETTPLPTHPRDMAVRQGLAPLPSPTPPPSLQVHPTVLAIMLELLDDTFRLDHLYGIWMTQGTEGHYMHASSV